MIYVKHLIACDSHEIPTEWTESQISSEALGENAAPAAAAAVVIRTTLNRKTFHSFVKVPGGEQGV